MVEDSGLINKGQMNEKRDLFDRCLSTGYV